MAVFGGERGRRRLKRWSAYAALFLVLAASFRWSGVRQYGDSYYALLVSQQLLAHGNVRLDAHFAPPLDPKRYDGLQADGLPYQIRRSGEHLYYFFPIGSSLLSLPLVAAARPLGLSVFDADGRYSYHADARLQRWLATLLAAFAAVVLAAMAGRLLGDRAGVGFGFLAALTTPLWSTVSRALWSHTWLLVLLGGVAYELVAARTGARRPRAALIGALLALAYLTRPTASLALAGVGLLFLLRDRRAAVGLALGAAPPLVAFVLWSRGEFGRWLPPYYRPSISFATFAEALAGNLVSPARGLLLFMPALLALAAIGWRCRRDLPHRDLLVLGLAIATAHWLVVSTFPHWWGGWAYGPRLMSDALPWLALAAAVVLAAAKLRREREGRPLGRGLRLALAATLAWGLVVHWGGATSNAAQRWNRLPVNVDRHPERLWDWRDPQLLAWLTPRPAP